MEFDCVIPKVIIIISSDLLHTNRTDSGNQMRYFSLAQSRAFGSFIVNKPSYVSLGVEDIEERFYSSRG